MTLCSSLSRARPAGDGSSLWKTSRRHTRKGYTVRSGRRQPQAYGSGSTKTANLRVKLIQCGRLQIDLFPLALDDAGANLLRGLAFLVRRIALVEFCPASGVVG